MELDTRPVLAHTLYYGEEEIVLEGREKFRIQVKRKTGPWVDLVDMEASANDEISVITKIQAEERTL